MSPREAKHAAEPPHDQHQYGRKLNDALTNLRKTHGAYENRATASKIFTFRKILRIAARTPPESRA